MTHSRRRGLLNPSSIGRHMFCHRHSRHIIRLARLFSRCLFTLDLVIGRLLHSELKAIRCTADKALSQEQCMIYTNCCCTIPQVSTLRAQLFLRAVRGASELQSVLSQRDAAKRKQQHLSQTAHQPLPRGSGRPEHLSGGVEACGPTACGHSVRVGRPLGWNWTTQPATWRCSRHVQPQAPASFRHVLDKLCRRAGGAPLLTFLNVCAHSDMLSLLHCCLCNAHRSA